MEEFPLKRTLLIASSLCVVLGLSAYVYKTQKDLPSDEMEASSNSPQEGIETVQPPRDRSEAPREIQKLSEDLETLNAEAVKLGEAGDWNRAAEIGRILIEKSPHTSHGFHILAASLIELNRPEEAAAVYVRGVYNNPKDRDLSDVAYDFIKASDIRFSEAMPELEAKPWGEQLRFAGLVEASNGNLDEAIKLRKDYIDFRETHLARDLADLATLYENALDAEGANRYLALSRDNRFNYPSEIQDEKENDEFFERYLAYLKRSDQNEEIERTQKKLAELKTQLKVIQK